MTHGSLSLGSAPCPREEVQTRTHAQVLLKALSEIVLALISAAMLDKGEKGITVLPPRKCNNKVIS